MKKTHMFNNVPEDAEQLILSNYLHRTEKENKVIRGLTFEGDPIFSCPRCRARSRSEPAHGVLNKCKKCHLNYVRYGNTLFIWESK
jgi:hypothetical protein